VLLEKHGGNGGAKENLDLVMELESRRHLLIGDYLHDLLLGGIWVLLKILASSFNGKI
jgi:hypothetical protein